MAAIPLLSVVSHKIRKGMEARKAFKRHFYDTWSGRFAVAMIAMMALIPMASAGTLYAVINGNANHLGQAPDGSRLNERNWGPGFQYDFDPWHDHWIPFVAASAFKDSNSNLSTYAGGGLLRRFMLSEKLDQLHLDVGLVAFLMTRKNYRHNHPFPGILPAVTFGTDHVAINATYIPKVEPKMVPLFYFQLKVKLLSF